MVISPDKGQKLLLRDLVFPFLYSIGLLVLFGVFSALSSGCKPQTVDPVPPDTLTNPGLTGTFSLCYTKSMGGYSNVVVSGATPRNITELSGNTPALNSDEYPQWSPDGQYIAFRRSASVYGPSLHIFDLVSGNDTNITADGGLVASLPQWTPDRQLCVAYQSPIGTQTATYLMRPDGSGKRKILETWSKSDFS
jgi:Tol biopolymer transport system component